MTRILIVDDIFANRLLLSEMANSLGCEYSLANNGKEAMEALEKNVPDIILMDIEMPVMNGLETTRRIRSERNPQISNIPVIALTAHNPNDFFDDFNSVGFDELLTKPYSLNKIRDLIEKYR